MGVPLCKMEQSQAKRFSIDFDRSNEVDFVNAFFYANDKENWVKRNTSKQMKEAMKKRTNHQINGKKHDPTRDLSISFKWKSQQNAAVSLCVHYWKKNVTKTSRRCE